MRISDGMLVREFLSNVAIIEERLFDRNVELSSGKKLQRPSQDPRGSARVLRLREQLSRINQDFRNIDQARVELNSTTEVLSSVRDLALDVTEKAGQGITGTADQQARDAVAAEIEDLLQSMLHASATTIDGKRIFSGAAVFTDPVALVGGVYVYQGDSQARMVEIAENRKVQTNIIGSDVFTNPSGDLFNTVRQLVDSLRAGDTTTAKLLLEDLAVSVESIDRARVTTGVGLNLLETTEEELHSRMIDLVAEKSRLEDADLTETATALTAEEIALTASLEAGSRVFHLSLFDFFG